MNLDIQNLFSDQQAVTGTGNILSTNAIDMGVAGTVAKDGAAVYHDLGRGGEDVEVFAQVVADCVGGTSLTFQLVMADDAALTTNLSVVQQTDAIPLATLKAGYQARFSCLPAGLSKRYLGMRYVAAGTFTAGGKVTSGLVADRQTNVSIG